MVGKWKEQNTIPGRLNADCGMSRRKDQMKREWSTLGVKALYAAISEEADMEDTSS